jgi:hypothetical protein
LGCAWKYRRRDYLQKNKNELSKVELDFIKQIEENENKLK